MPVHKITIQEFISFSKSMPVLDVRSPGEYQHAHIPGALSLPLFSDEERKIVGTAYKNESRETAIKLGLDFFAPKMRNFVEQAEKITESFTLKRVAQKENNSDPAEPVSRNPQPENVLVHCWRGGMRSSAVAWLLDLYGFKVYRLAGGYKAYRNYVLQQFQVPCNFKIIGGYTGSGKTVLLQQLQKENKFVVDLEALANHKGSALGSLGKGMQPGQEMFENELAKALSAFDAGSIIFLEDESQRIGDLQIPPALWHTIRQSPVYFLAIPFEERLTYLTNEYQAQSKEELMNAIMRIQKRLGGLETKNALNFLSEDNHKECFRILLKYYDKYYNKALHNRDATLIKKIYLNAIDPVENIKHILKA